MKIIKIGQEARDSLKRGIDLVARCVAPTLGPAGRNAVLGRQNVTPIITNDGVTIAHSIEAEDEIEQNGVMIVRESAQLTDTNAGDGTTTTTVLLKAITDTLFDKIKDDDLLISNKTNVIELKKDVDTWCARVCEELRKQAKPITKEDIYNVALVSAEYNWIAKIVTEIYSQIGTSGYVEIQESQNTSYEVLKGIEVSSGYPSEYYINNNKRECVIHSPNILVTNRSLSIQDILPLIESMSKLEEDNIVIFAPEFSEDLTRRLIATKAKSQEVCLIPIKLQEYGKTDKSRDIASLTNAQFIDKDITQPLVWGMLGKAEKAVITDTKTMIMGGSGDTTQRVTELKDIMAKTDSVFDKDVLEKRIAYLSGGIAIVKVGAESQFEKTYFKLKFEDAINAVKSALEEGVVKGGGLALKEISESLEPNILTKALKSPYQQIQDNAGGNLAILDTVVDPVKTTISALKSACSLAGTLITTEVAVAYKREKNNDK